MNRKKSQVVAFVLSMLCFPMMLLSAQVLSEDSGLTVYDTDNWEIDHAHENISRVVIFGWSNDGKVAIYQPGDQERPIWLIIDTVSDEILESANLTISINHEDPFPSLMEAMEEYGISRNPGTKVSLPYQYPSGLPPLQIVYRNEGRNDYSVLAVRGSTRKKISEQWNLGRNGSIRDTYAVKSPYENRLLIITVNVGYHIEFDYAIYQPQYAGCHLTYGFE